MAQFSIYLISPRGVFNLTNYNSVAGQFLGNTFDEQIKLGTDDSSFVFSMLKYRYQDNKKVVNELALRIIHGALIKVQTQGKDYTFCVNNITYTFLPDNLQLTFTCQDAFQAIVSKMGIGYTITNDTNDRYYIGAQSIDDWAEQIVRENNLDWTYISIDAANNDLLIRSAAQEEIAKRDNLQNVEAWQLVDTEYSETLQRNPATLNVSVSFSCSDVNAYEALKQLASQNELIIKSNYSTRCFWFEPRKNWFFKGYYVRPDINLEQFGLEGRGDNLTTVLNVIGPTDIDDNEITLVPSLPPVVQNFIESDDWLKSHYYPNLYLDLYRKNVLEFDTLADFPVTGEAGKTYIANDTGYVYRWNGTTYIQVGTSKETEEEAQDAVFLRQIAATPWLENKLINIDYFTDRHLLTYETEEINEILNNKLRIINGRLINASRGFFSQQEKWMQTITKLESEGEIVMGHMVSDIQYTYDQMFDIDRLKQIQDYTEGDHFHKVENFNNVTSEPGDIYFNMATGGFYRGANNDFEQLSTNYRYYPSSVKWPLILNLYEDRNGIQYYCGAPFLSYDGISLQGGQITTNAPEGHEAPLYDNDPFAPLPTQPGEHSLYNWNSFTVESAKNARWLQMVANNQELSDKYYFPLANGGVTNSAITILNSFVEAVHFRQKILDLPSESIVDLDYFLQERAASQESLHQLLIDNTYKFRQELSKIPFLVKMRKVGIVTDNNGQPPSDTDYVTTLDRVNMLSQDTFTQDEIDYLYNYFVPSATPVTGAENGHATRDTIIGVCASIEGSLTQYWKVMRSCGLKLGLFFPETWDCLDVLALLQDNFVKAVTEPFLNSYVRFLPITYLPSTQKYDLTSTYNVSDNIICQNIYPYKFKFYDRQKQLLYPLKTVFSTTNRSSSNTDLNYILVSDDVTSTAVFSQMPYFKVYYDHRKSNTHLSSVLELYYTQSTIRQPVYCLKNGGYTNIGYAECADILNSCLCNVNPQSGQSNPGWDIHDATWQRYEFNPTMSIPFWLSTHEIGGTEYYYWQVEHNKMWQELYGKYPGIFRESVYKDTAAKNSIELYNAAKAQLEQLSQPEFSYNITALDIYMYNQDLQPLNIQLGDQIRIDYQDEPTRFDLVNKALREALFVTGITHTLRTDGDYQFTVETRRATDVMVQRFAQLLSSGR